MQKNILNEVNRMREMMGLDETQLDLFTGTEDAIDQPNDDQEGYNQKEHIGKRVMVYYNLHKHTFSIQYKGLLMLHADYVKLANVEFRVRKGGLEKVRVEKQKNIHAFVIGTLVDYMEYPATHVPSPSTTKSITYDPYKYDSFVYKDTQEPVYKAGEVEMINQAGGKKGIYQINEGEGVHPMNEDMKVSYDPSKIDEFLADAIKSVENAKGGIDKYGSTVINTTMKAIFENLPGSKSLLNEIENLKKITEAKFNKYFDVVELYDWSERPDNVSKLDKLVTDLDNHTMTISEIYEIFDDLIRATERVAKYNQDLFSIQTFK